MTTSSSDFLCQPLDITKAQAIVLQKELIPGCRMCLRPVSLHTNNDINVIHEWLSEVYPAHLPVDQLRVFFILLAECTYAQAFMVLLNDDTPVSQFEVYQVWHDELKELVDAGEGDYRINIPVMPVVQPASDITVLIIQACLYYFFSCQEVKRVFWVVPVNDKDRNKIAVKCGAQLYPSEHETIMEGGQAANIYYFLPVDSLLP
jgi:hypothetical protein